MNYKYFNSLLFAVILFTFSACEEVIVLDLSSAEPQIVILANLNATDNSCSVSLSRTADFYDNNDFEQIDGAAIFLTTASGDIYTLDGIGEGNYATSSINTNPGEIVTIDIETTDNQKFTASAMVPKLVALDTLLLEEKEAGGFMGGDSEGDYELSVEWNDLAGEENFYRIKIFRNSEFQSGVYVLSNDVLNEGSTLSRPIIGERYAIGDELKVQLLSVNRGYFDYLSDIANGEGRGLSSPVPYNPKGNFDNNAIGYFGVWQVSEKIIIVE